jgi:5-bromo-4-chloroindolyl phosphate hydrolysis protein
MEKSGVTYKETKVKVINPVYAIGLTWLLYGLLLPMYRITDLVIAGAVSVLAFIAARRFLPDRVVITPLTEKGSLDRHCMEMIDKGYAYIKELERCNDLIPEVGLSNQIDEITEISRQMFGYAAKNPKIATDLRSFIDYYYPTSIKLLQTYADMREQAVKSKNIDEIMEKVDSIMGTVAAAFLKQLDIMFADTRLDIKTDSDVLKSVLASEGLAGKDGVSSPKTEG